MASEYQKMIAGEPYRPSDPELRVLAQASRQKQAAFNKEEDPLKGAEIIKTWFGSTGQNLYVNPRLVVDYGVNIHLGENFYSNWNLTMLDV
ncbi:MAG: sugar O-acetyltransferase, partial [Streptococcus sp.]|nr:sugar O-acetyltransferase [Streptococcus sp.]